MPFEISPALTRSFKPPDALLPWLTHAEELSAKLRQTAGQVALHVLKQDWVPTGWWERSVLGLTLATVVQREVIVSVAETPCWYGRTVIPEMTWLNNQSFFARLRQESLGALVFYTDEVVRVRTEYYAVNSSCMEYYWPDRGLTQNESLLWIRLSEFSLSEKYPFHLIEILLPGLLRVI
ncbi:chorismate--pyruvate lyase family protein [Legionella taurinensis]|uniref:Chorismate lyase n=1 Tax=Legionella taurinensis TaxID=70611 RepID=A0A3A5L2N3_9GAMM|nr:chorismate lyase [Legionella taurinensis]RJT45556.1 chorismate lyase [Legionella taurinensis]RJT66172.1 chorismate lyase [Legionella taurinensis]STY26305.1 4-hydroxybenzoate synthetase [Legionella taurinensis]